VSKPISRVLYLAIIYLGLSSPAGSSDLPFGKRRTTAFQALCLATITSLFGLAPGGVYTAGLLPEPPVSSYLTISTLPALRAGGVFLLHFP